MSIVRNGLAALLVGAVAVGAVAEEEAPKHKLELRASKWQAGDTVTYAANSKNTELVEVSGPDGTVMMTQKETKTSAWEAVVKALEVDETGKRTKCLVHFKKYSRKSEASVTMGGQDQERNSEDDSLTGVTIEVAAGDWKAVDGAWKLTPAGKAFIKDNFLKSHYVDDTHDLHKAAAPSEPVAAAGTWQPDVKAFIAAIEYTQPIKCDAEKSSVSLTLKSVAKDGEIEYASLEAKHAYIVTEVINQGMPMQFGEGSKVDQTESTRIAVSGRLRPYETKSSSDFRGTINMGQEISVSNSGTAGESMTVGGTIPEKKKKKDEKPGGLAPAVPSDPGSGGGKDD